MRNPARAIWLDHDSIAQVKSFWTTRSIIQPIPSVSTMALFHGLCVAFCLAWSPTVANSKKPHEISRIFSDGPTKNRWLAEKSNDSVFAYDFAKIQAHKALLDEGEDEERSRNLVWDLTESLCSPELLAGLAFTPTLCLYSELQWDPAGTFTATGLFTTTPTPFFDTIIQLPVTTYIGYYNGDRCNEFDGCSFVDDGEVLAGQYGYDCR